MNQDNGRLNFVATVDTSQTKKDADELVRIFQSIGKSAERYGIDIDKYIGGGLRTSNDAQRAVKGIAEELKVTGGCRSIVEPAIQRGIIGNV